MDSDYKKKSTLSSCMSLKSNRSKSPPPDLSSGETMKDRNAVPPGATLPLSGQWEKTGECDLRLPTLIEDWTREHVKDWLSAPATSSSSCHSHASGFWFAAAGKTHSRKLPSSPACLPAHPHCILYSPVSSSPPPPANLHLQPLFLSAIDSIAPFLALLFL
ncbi:uncharacterized protein LOC120435685 isoform X2 [Oreochromis aureus]|uniref:uncharacterized protein LOC120435685 isoform X2 n=1 Tax=Oreochromis aureus TaxID=47969 RepID=UPI001952FC38|nr:uncharacterized protein LOC120435685 isoform X2 [Oreochromis aureus]